MAGIDSMDVSKNPYFVTDFELYAALLASIGQFDKYLKITKDVHQNNLRHSFENSSDLGASWSRLAMAYLVTNNVDSAYFCTQKSLEIYRALNEPISFYTALVVNGRIFEKKRDYKSAENDYREGLALIQNVENFSQIVIAEGLIHLARVLRKQARYSEAIEANEKIFIILRRILLNPTHDDYLKAQLNRALIHTAQAEPTAAIDSLTGVFGHIQERIVKQFDFLTESEKVAFMTLLDADFFSTMQTAYSRLYTQGEAAKSGSAFYNTVLMQKELSFADTRSLMRKAAALGDTVVQAKIFKLITLQKNVNDNPTAV